MSAGDRGGSEPRAPHPPRTRRPLSRWGVATRPATSGRSAAWARSTARLSEPVREPPRGSHGFISLGCSTLHQGPPNPADPWVSRRTPAPRRPSRTTPPASARDRLGPGPVGKSRRLSTLLSYFTSDHSPSHRTPHLVTSRAAPAPTGLSVTVTATSDAMKPVRLRLHPNHPPPPFPCLPAAPRGGRAACRSPDRATADTPRRVPAQQASRHLCQDLCTTNHIPRAYTYKRSSDPRIKH
jgi:hypothetical protein